MEKELFVGREREPAQRTAYLDRALAGRGQVCFVVGEAGSGKTALTDCFLEQALAAHPNGRPRPVYGGAAACPGGAW